LNRRQACSDDLTFYDIHIQTLLALSEDNDDYDDNDDDDGDNDAFITVTKTCLVFFLIKQLYEKGV